MRLGGNADAEAVLRAIPQNTLRWIREQLAPRERIDGAIRLWGGWTSDVHRLDVCGPGGPRALVLRSFVQEIFHAHAEGLLTREASVFRLLEPTGLPIPRLLAVDATAAHCEYPSLLMSLLPGEVRLDDAGAAERAELLARQLVAIHGLEVSEHARPRDYEAWTAPDQVNRPPGTSRPELWRRVVDGIRRDPPGHVACFLHRDFHPGNVLFEGSGGAQRVSGVVDWVETSWGPADLDVAHCSTNLALLHGVPAGMAFAERYRRAGGSLSEDPAAHLYWRLLDALSFADGEKVADPWRDLGRTDLNDEVVASRLEDYLQALIDRYDRG